MKEKQSKKTEEREIKKSMWYVLYVSFPPFPPLSFSPYLIFLLYFRPTRDLGSKSFQRGGGCNIPTLSYLYIPIYMFRLIRLNSPFDVCSSFLPTR